MENSKRSWTASLGRRFLVRAVALAGMGLTGGGDARAWTLTTLYSFCAEGGTKCTDGAYPQMGLVMDKSGNLYGTTGGGGAYGQGTVFELSPTATGPWGQTTWTFKVLHSFCAQGGTKCTDGAIPMGESLIMDAWGNLYATTFLGGAHGRRSRHRRHSIELSPNADKTIWTYKTRTTFVRSPTAPTAKPSAGVVLAPSELMARRRTAAFITPCANSISQKGCGTVFELTPDAADSTWK